MDKVKEQQRQWLERIFENWMPPTPAFKANHKGVPDGMVPYISCSDVHDYVYNIRVIPRDIFLSNDDDSYQKKENGEIIAHYDSLEDLVEDGWMLD
jgi:hypothetical protein